MFVLRVYYHNSEIPLMSNTQLLINQLQDILTRGSVNCLQVSSSLLIV